MERNIYKEIQLNSLNQAIKYSEQAIDTAKALQSLFDKDKDSSDSSMADSLKYFDVNNAFAMVEWLQLQIKDLKSKLIEIKVNNDNMLLEGGFIRSIDEEIASVFLRNVFCKIKAMDENTVTALEDVRNTLINLKEEVSLLDVTENKGGGSR